MMINIRRYFNPFIIAVVAEYLVHVSCQTDHTASPPTEATGLPLLLTLISVVGSLFGLVCLGIIGLICFYFRRVRKEKNYPLPQDRSKSTAEEQELSTRVFYIKPPVIGSSMYDVSTVVEIVKSKGDTTDMAVAPERSFATLVDRPVIVNPEKQRIDDDVTLDTTDEETKVPYMANYQRRFTDVTCDDDATSPMYESTSKDRFFGSPVDTHNPDPDGDPVFGSPVDIHNPDPDGR
ncbi:uncharacterized protein [Asterias amurensis]|uniref:uncharacterized protein n=1 Tax=Asterias amurensis TaxID=7602 RepID=UPI003AB413D0